eukprot:scaffold23655_cov139-Isochrysis_galbana.AAC.1
MEGLAKAAAPKGATMAAAAEGRLKLKTRRRFPVSKPGQAPPAAPPPRPPTHPPHPASSLQAPLPEE